MLGRIAEKGKKMGYSQISRTLEAHVSYRSSPQTLGSTHSVEVQLELGAADSDRAEVQRVVVVLRRGSNGAGGGSSSGGLDVGRGSALVLVVDLGHLDGPVLPDGAAENLVEAERVTLLNGPAVDWAGQ